MKIFKRVLITIFFIIIITIAAGYLWLRSTKPVYSGDIQMPGLKSKVEVIFDDYGVPHIYAQNSHDAYIALGYVHAQERLFQMEMIRRVTSGRLSELLGPRFINTDKTMLTLSIRKMAQRSAEKFFDEVDEPYKKETIAYLDGINSFIDNGDLPIEFTVLGVKPEHFKPVDVYTAIGYMSLSFTSALSQEPLVTTILETLGEEYLIDFEVDSISNSKYYHEERDEVKMDIVRKTIEVMASLPIPVWNGSNNWVLSPDRSKSGKVLLANDTHIRYSQPAVWYEACLEYPGFSMAGYYLSGVPYAIMGHNNNFAWGTTIFPFDNMDLYREKLNPDNSNQYWAIDGWKELITENVSIPVKDQEDVNLKIKKTRHGPILNGVYNNIATEDEPPISLWWALNEMESQVLEALYRVNNTKQMSDFESAMKFIDLIGMNMIYGDAEGNIALWSAGRIPKRNKEVNSKIILDGASGKDDILGYYPFEKNPRIINPEDGFITTANDEHERVDGILYPGYYAPGLRAARIKKLINSKDRWSLEELKEVQLDNTSERDTMLVNLILGEANVTYITSLGPAYNMALSQLSDWNGNTDVSSIGATIFNNLVYYLMYNIISDELGSEDAEGAVGSFLVRSQMSKILTNTDSPWFDNINTKKKETRAEIFTESLEITITSLIKQFGEDVSSWRWGKVHTLTHVHPFGQEEPLDIIFNVGPFEKSGGNDVIDKEGFRYNESGLFPVIDGPAMRMLVDFAHPDRILTIIPTGQSGNIMSPYYSDQSYMFNSGMYRELITDKHELIRDNVLYLIPN